MTGSDYLTLLTRRKALQNDLRTLGLFKSRQKFANAELPRWCMEVMRLRGDYFHTRTDLYLGKKLLNELKLQTGKGLPRCK